MPKLDKPQIPQKGMEYAEFILYNYLMDGTEDSI